MLSNIGSIYIYIYIERERERERERENSMFGVTNAKIDALLTHVESTTEAKYFVQVAKIVGIKITSFSK